MSEDATSEPVEVTTQPWLIHAPISDSVVSLTTKLVQPDETYGDIILRVKASADDMSFPNEDNLPIEDYSHLEVHLYSQSNPTEERTPSTLGLSKNFDAYWTAGGGLFLPKEILAGLRVALDSYAKSYVSES